LPRVALPLFIFLKGAYPMAKPKGPDRAMLAEHNVTLTEAWGAYRLTCGQCGASWDVQPPAAGGRLPAGYWQCPKGCNMVDQAPVKPAPAAVIPTDLDALPAILTPAEAALLLRVSETTVKDWARRGDLPGAFKLGKEWRVERKALLEYIRGA
jgi:excisionase family DNA binding protein